jgi:hypothetical protein
MVCRWAEIEFNAQQNALIHIHLDIEKRPAASWSFPIAGDRLESDMITDRLQLENDLAQLARKNVG